MFVLPMHVACFPAIAHRHQPQRVNPLQWWLPCCCTGCVATAVSAAAAGQSTLWKAHHNWEINGMIEDLACLKINTDRGPSIPAWKCIVEWDSITSMNTVINLIMSKTHPLSFPRGSN